ncbi:MAG TPA: RnfH family protein [Burkholderiales bacterium]|nr:RnfH family protein [Burkholderiales bacterium]
MADDALISIEVVYARAQAQDVVTLQVREGASVSETIALSGLMGRYPELADAKVGIFGRVVPPDTRVRDGDRVELYRALVADPKHARRRRAERAS